MPSGDEPQLGGRSADPGDLSPMISSVQTRAIAQARGAYEASNLDALVRLLDAGQALRFRRVVVQQAIHHAAPILAASGEGPERDALAMVSRWLDNPTPGREIRINALAMELNAVIRRVLPIGGIRAERLIAYFLARSASPDRHLAANGAWRVVQLAAESRRERAGGPFTSPNDAVNAAFRWQVEAAWAILRGRAVPPLPQ